MKQKIRSLAVAASLIVLISVAFSAADARTAKSSGGSEMVRLSQTRLANLGYFSGTYDGKLGTPTVKALSDFQSKNNLPVTGTLTTQTYDLLVAKDYEQSHHVEGIKTNALVGNDPNIVQEEVWHQVASQKLPIRFGEFTVVEELKGALHRYTLSLNGQPIMVADNQPGALQISKIFPLEGEDALVVTAYRGDENCVYRNTLITLHENGSSASKHEFESCSPANEVHEAFKALFIRFAGTMNKDGYADWDVWRYENAKLVRL